MNEVPGYTSSLVKGVILDCVKPWGNVEGPEVMGHVPFGTLYSPLYTQWAVTPVTGEPSMLILGHSHRGPWVVNVWPRGMSLLIHYFARRAVVVHAPGKFSGKSSS